MNSGTNRIKWHKSSLAWFLLILLSLVWGSSFILIKKALVSFDGMQVGAGRIVIAFLAFTPIFTYRFKDIDWSKFKWFLIVGLCGSGLPSFLFAIAQLHISSAIAGVMNSLTPIFTFILAILIFRHKFSIVQLLGIIAGFAGVICIFLTNSGTENNVPLFYGSLIILATLLYGISANTVGHFLKETDPIIISTISFILIGPFVLVYLLNTDFLYQISTHEYGYRSLGALMILSIVGTFGANILFFILVQITDAVFSTTVSFLIPFVALFWGFLDGEELHLLHIIALLLILSGLYLIKKKT